MGVVVDDTGADECAVGHAGPAIRDNAGGPDDTAGAGGLGMLCDDSVVSGECTVDPLLVSGSAGRPEIEGRGALHRGEADSFFGDAKRAWGVCASIAGVWEAGMAAGAECSSAHSVSRDAGCMDAAAAAGAAFCRRRAGY